MVHPTNSNSARRERTSKILLGIAVISFGVLFLLQRQGTNLPHWLISWKTIMIIGGLLSLYKHKFRSFFAWAVVGVGVALLINDFQPQSVNKQLILPILVIVFGVHLVLKHTVYRSTKNGGQTNLFDDEKSISSEDFVKSTTLFGGVTKNVVSKTFRGANLVTVFGGTEINLMKAEIEGPIQISTKTIFGGTTLIVPPHWQVHSNVTTIAGSIEDQRGLPSDVSYDSTKVVTLEGTCLFGGVEIRSYA